MIPKRFENANWEDVPKKIKDILTNILQTRRGIYIWGQAGTGKTHIIYAINKHYLLNNAKPKIISNVYNVPSLLKSIKDDFDRKPADKDNLLDRIIENRDLLILDDLGSEKMSEWVEEVFYLLINKKYEEMIPIIFTSNYSIDELSDRISDRIVSRIIGSCDVIELSGEDRRMNK